MEQVEIILGPIKSYLRGYIPKQLYKNIDALLSFRIEQAEFVPSFQDGRWDGRIRLFDMSDLSFPTGCFSKLKKLLAESNVQFVIKDERPKSERIFDWQWVSKEIKILYPYQLDAVAAAIQTKVGIIQVATGGGKTIIMCRFIQELGRKTLVLVHKLDLLEQARNKIIETIGVDVGYIGNGRCEIKDITVGTVQTIVKSLGFKYVKFMDDEQDEKCDLKEVEKEQVRHLLRTINVVIIDESHHVRSETQQEIMNAIPSADFRIGLSATPMRDQGDDLLIEGIFGEVLCKISATYLIQNKFLIPPIIRFNTIDYTCFKFFEFVKVDNDGNISYCNPPPSTGKGTRRRKIDMDWPVLAQRNITKLEDIKEEDVLYTFNDGSRIVRKWINYEGPTNYIHHIHTKLDEICETVFAAVLENEIIKENFVFKQNDEYKKFVKKVKRKYKDLIMKKKYAFIYDACITDNEYRNAYITQLLNLHRMEKRAVLVLVSRIRHGDNLLRMMPPEIIFLKGEDDIETRKDMMGKLKKKEMDAVIASTIADEGLDVPALDVVIMAGGGTSKTTALQRVGRAIRLYPGKEKAYIEEFYDDALYLGKHSRDREVVYRTEPAFEIIR